MGQVDFLSIAVGHAAQVIEFVHVVDQVDEAIGDVGSISVDLLKLLLEDLDQSIESVVDRVEVQVRPRVFILCELHEQHGVRC